MIRNLMLIFCYIICVTIAQIILKITLSGSPTNKIDFSFFINTFLNPKIMIGLFLYGLSFVIWIVVLSRVEITFAYPLLSLSVVIVALISWVFLGETFNILRLSGMILTIVGAWLIIQS